MDYTLYQKGTYQIIQFNEVLSISSRIKDLDDVVAKLLDNKHTSIVLKFKDRTYLNSHCCSAIIRCYEAIMETGGKMAIINSNNDIKDFLEIVGFEKKIEIFLSDQELP